LPGALRPSLALSVSWRYTCPRRSRVTLLLAIVISLAIHAGIFFGIGARRKLAPRAVEQNVIALTFTIPQLKELEEPEPTPNDEGATKPDLGLPTPMQADLPQIPLPNDFVQQIDFSSLIEKPDLSPSKIWTIPENIQRVGRAGSGMGNVFNLSDLDRIPEPVMQPAPVYPMSLKAAGPTAKVIVEFIVDTQGRVVNPFAVESDYPGFDEAATTGVQKWRFRPGVRAGNKVNTRMRVPIVFRVVNVLD
jgi:protein TonB